MRSSSTIDIGKLANMIRSPGIDTRVWVSFAVVKAVRIVTAAQATSRLNAGVYADLTLLPYEEEYTGMVTTTYASTNAGFYAPLAVDDTVLVAIPYGDSAAGIAILARYHDSADPPPEEFAENEGQDVVLVAEEEVNIRLITKGAGETQIEAKGDGSVRITTKGSGNIVMNPESSGKVGVGGEPGSAGMQPIALGNSTTTALDNIVSALWSGLTGELARIQASLGSVPAPVPYVPGAAPTIPSILATKGEVK